MAEAARKIEEQLDPVAEAAALVGRGRAAMEEFENHDQGRIDEAVTALAWSIYKPENAEMLAELAVELSDIRSRGYSTDNEEFMDGMTAIAVPIRDSEGKAVAALSVHALQIRMPKEKALTYLDTMNAMAERVARAWSLRGE